MGSPILNAEKPRTPIQKRLNELVVALCLLGGLVFHRGGLFYAINRWHADEQTRWLGPAVWLLGIFSLTAPATGAVRTPRAIAAALLMAASGFLSVISVQMGVGFGEAFALWVWLFAFCLAVLPRMSASRLTKLMVVLLVNLPLPVYVSTRLAFQMREWSTTFSALLMKPVWGDVSVLGNVIRFGAHELTVAPECSGINTLFAMIALASGLALLEKHLSRAYFILLISAPLALFSNVVRIFIIALGIQGGGSWVHGSAHEWIGVVTFFFVSTFLAALLRPKKPVPIPDEPRRASPLAACVGTALFAVFFLFQAPLLESAATQEQQQAFDPHFPGRPRDTVAVTDEEKKILGTDDMHYFRFGSSLSPEVYLLQIGAGGIAHAPETCLLSEGYTQERYPDETTFDPAWTEEVFKKDENDHLLVAYTFESHGKRSPSYFTYRTSSLFKKTRSAVFYRVSIPFGPTKIVKDIGSARAELKSFVSDFKPSS